MGCVRSKEDKGAALKYRPDNSNATPVNAHLGHYGPDPTLMGHSPAMKTHNNSYNSHAAALTPFGGATSVMTPFGGASTSFTSVAVSSPFPSVITGQSRQRVCSRGEHGTTDSTYLTNGWNLLQHFIQNEECKFVQVICKPNTLKTTFHYFVIRCKSMYNW